MYKQNFIQLVIIFDLTSVWLVFKILKADMGFRCNSVPCCSRLVSASMALIRFFAFLFGVFIFIFGVIGNCYMTFRAMIRVNNHEHDHRKFNLAILYFSFMGYSALIILLLYTIIVCKRKSDLRQGWAKRFDKVMLTLTRMFLGTSRLMVVHFESHDEMCQILIDQTKKENERIKQRLEQKHF